MDKKQTAGVLETAIGHTPGWVWGFSGGMVTLTVCVIAVLQLGGFTPPLQRIMNAKATEIEQAATKISGSALKLEGIVARMESLDSRVTVLESRVDKIDQYHRGAGVAP